jgi:hypothetical protein
VQPAHRGACGPTGYSVIVKDNQVSGAFPEALRELGRQYGCEFVFPWCHARAARICS